MKIMYVDLDLAKEISRIESGGFYEYKKEKYDVVDNRAIEKNIFELAIEYAHTYFVTVYSIEDENISFLSESEGKVKFVPKVREIQISYEYKNSNEAKDAYDPEKVVEVIQQLKNGVAFVPINEEYYLINQVINRKNRTKIEAKTHKHKGIVGTRDIVNIEAFLKVVEKTHIVDYAIEFKVKDNFPMLIVKMDIGIEKGDWQQQSLFDEDAPVDELEVIYLGEEKEQETPIETESPLASGDTAEDVVNNLTA